MRRVTVLAAPERVEMHVEVECGTDSTHCRTGTSGGRVSRATWGEGPASDIACYDNLPPLPSIVAPSIVLPDFETSMLQDLRRGRRLEHYAISGAVVRAAGRTGVVVPFNRTLLALLDGMDPRRVR